MTLRDIGEFGLIDRLQRIIARGQGSLPNDLFIGIGDDAAVWRPRPGEYVVSTVDTLVESVHFRRQFSSWPDIGWKAMAVNLSDMAAMGAEPRWALVSLTLPPASALDNVLDLYRGMIACGRKFDTRIIGGNVSSGRQIVISVTVTGSAARRNIWTRSGARVNDVIAVTGELGAAAAGWTALRKQIPAARAIRRYRRPFPRLKEIRKIQKARIKIHAAIDISDGLAGDLQHICSASQTGAEIHLERLPIASSTKRLAEKLNHPAERWALAGGEDYELLLTMTQEEFIKSGRILGTQLTRIGTITSPRTIRYYDHGRRVNINVSGFRHF